MEETREAQLERGAQVYNSKMREDAINVISKEYPDSVAESFVPISEIRRIFNYLENYCKIICGGKIPDKIFRTAAPCSAFQIRNRVMDFISNNFYTYKQMNSKEIIIKVYGEDKYNEALEIFSRNNPDEEELAFELELEREEPAGSINGTMEDVDGGSKNRRRNKTKKQKRAKKGKKTKKGKKMERRYQKSKKRHN
jgi:hypothetical protein